MSDPYPDFERLVGDEAVRREEFPVAARRVFLAHAGVTVLPRRVAAAMQGYIERSALDHQEFGDVLRDVARTRVVCAEWIGAQPDEIALLGPTSLGLSLFANGIDWRAGDEVVCYHDDYPANVYPWMDLARKGVKVVYVEPEEPGAITPELVAAAMTGRTRLVALATAHFLTGHRIDVDAIGRVAHAGGALFALDAIQTLGAFPLSVEHVDMLSADAHKWMLGPLAIGVVFVKREHFGTVHPTLLGAWNVQSPNFIAMDVVEFVDSAQRYEPGVLNVAGIYGMREAVRMIMHYGQGRVADRITMLRGHLRARLEPEGFVFLGPAPGQACGGMISFRHPRLRMGEAFAKLEGAGVVVSHRHLRDGRDFLRASPHFYNTVDEMDRVAELLLEEVHR